MILGNHRQTPCSPLSCSVALGPIQKKLDGSFPFQMKTPPISFSIHQWNYLGDTERRRIRASPNPYRPELCQKTSGSLMVQRLSRKLLTQWRHLLAHRSSSGFPQKGTSNLDSSSRIFSCRAMEIMPAPFFNDLKMSPNLESIQWGGKLQEIWITYMV